MPESKVLIAVQIRLCNQESKPYTRNRQLMVFEGRELLVLHFEFDLNLRARVSCHTLSVCILYLQKNAFSYCCSYSASCVLLTGKLWNKNIRKSVFLFNETPYFCWKKIHPGMTVRLQRDTLDPVVPLQAF